MSGYQPGTCNIGPTERRRRRAIGGLSLLVAAGYVAFVVATGRPAGLLLGAFPFLFGGLLGIVQDRMGFCAGFGVLGRYDLSGADGGDAGRSSEAAAVRRDRVQAFRVVAIALGGALVATLVVYAAGVAVL